MSNNERIIENGCATMSMEGFAVTEAEKEVAFKCLEGKLDFDKVIDELITQYKK